MKIKTYSVIGRDYEVNDLLGVYSSLFKAQKAIETFKKKNAEASVEDHVTYANYYIQENVLDGEPEHSYGWPKSQYYPA
jgi:hypothetical protein